jgi:murein L,D-transpeptidase YcbB/YkuD
MQTFKAYLLMLFFVGILAAASYWAVSTIGDPVAAKNDDIRVIAQDVPAVNVASVVESEEIDVVENIIEDIVIENDFQDLINNLQELADKSILLKNGSNNANVKTVQDFLNIYNDTSGGVDGDFGPGTASKVKNFQSEQGLTADGQAGPGTYKKMIEFLDN